LTTSLGTWFSDLKEGLINNVVSLGVDIGSWFNSLFSKGDGIISSIVNLPSTIINGFKDLFTTLFVPSNDYFTGTFGSVKEKAMNKFGVHDLNGLNQLNVSESSPNDVSVTLIVSGVSFTGKIIDMSFIDKYRNTFKAWVGGFIAVLLIIYNYSQVLWLIRGTSPIVTTSTITTGSYVSKGE